MQSVRQVRVNKESFRKLIGESERIVKVGAAFDSTVLRLCRVLRNSALSLLRHDQSRQQEHTTDIAQRLAHVD
jgi:hypothetical protein